MEFSITTKGPDEVFLFQGLPEKLKSYSVEGAKSSCASGGFGYILFNQIEGNGFAIWYSNYIITNDTTFIGRADEPVLELHFTFCKHIEYYLEGVGNSVLSDGQFNITYTPFINNKVTLPSGQNFYTFDIHFDLNFLERFTSGSSDLSIFLDAIDTGIPANITPQPHFATIEMIRVIRSLIKNNFHGEFLKFYIESQVIVLLIEVLERISKDQQNKELIKLTTSDTDRIRAAKDYIIQHMDNPPSIIQLARIVGINDFKLKKGFKQVFGTTIFQYLEDARMDKAMFMIKETEMTIAEIGYSLGFAYPTYFSAAFKRKFGYPPGHFKK